MHSARMPSYATRRVPQTERKFIAGEVLGVVANRSNRYVNIKAGSTATFYWDTWPATHKGYVLALD